jgi:hypothetical protein
VDFQDPGDVDVSHRILKCVAHGVYVGQDVDCRRVAYWEAILKVGAHPQKTLRRDSEPFDMRGGHRFSPEQEPGEGLGVCKCICRLIEVHDRPFGVGNVRGDPTIEKEFPTGEIVGDIGLIKATLAEPPRDADSSEVRLPECPRQGSHKL